MLGQFILVLRLQQEWKGRVSVYSSFASLPISGNVSFLHPLKTSESQKFSKVFRGCRNGTLAWNELNREILTRYLNKDSRLIYFNCFRIWTYIFSSYLSTNLNSIDSYFSKLKACTWSSPKALVPVPLSWQYFQTKCNSKKYDVF